MIVNSSVLISAILLSFSRRLGVLAMGDISFTSTNNTISSKYSGIHSIAYVTTPTEDVAKKLAHGLISEKLAACINIVPKITSIYLWEGKVNEDNEAMMIIKTKTSKVDDLTHYIKKNHPYSVCEVISTKIDNGNEAYLKWVDESVP
ncbi:hypothetical protein WA026_016789 [Henosepilachna vigintioctopunctata]|uniref:Uncharacterized protein n=1 Tax=Henosepilachna vigintioctopunctata TaxID=420089 RepID=A0AAW1UUJ0_9CUCU